MDGDLGSDTEGVEDRRAPWHSDVIKYSKTGTSDSMDTVRQLLGLSLPLIFALNQPCLKKRSNIT